MKIVHLCLNGPYTENWGYQENVLSKYHAMMGAQVTVIAQNRKHAETGEIVDTDCEDYVNRFGVRVIRVAPKPPPIKRVGDVFRRSCIFHILKSINPALVMIHGLMGDLSALQVRNYIRKINPSCICVADIHEDALVVVPAKSEVKRWILKKAHQILNARMYAYYRKVYYVAPSSEEYALNYYRVPKQMLELLPLGCDPALIRQKNKVEVRKAIRTQYGVKRDSLLICHGGKIDAQKRTVELIQAISLMHLSGSKVELLLFGSINKEHEPSIQAALAGTEDYIHFAGQLSASEYYDIFLASDIAVFPGSQSSLWQEAIGCGLAIVVKEHIEIAYLDLGGNIEILKEGTASEIRETLTDIVESGQHVRMSQVAEARGLNYFSYERIAQQVLDCASSEKATHAQQIT